MTKQSDPLPVRMEALPVDGKGRPVPWFVQWMKDGECVPAGQGEPEFRAMDPRKFALAIKEKLCWVCGGRLGYRYVFVAGPMCGINRTSSEPPSHPDCARWSARNCPFLSNPKMVRREDDLVNNPSMRENVAGLPLTRNPGVTMLWTTKEYEVFSTKSMTGKDGYLIQMGEPTQVDWFACGREATRAEVLESIESGLPYLETLARQQHGGLEALARYRRRFEKWIPSEEATPHTD